MKTRFPFVFVCLCMFASCQVKKEKELLRLAIVESNPKPEQVDSTIKCLKNRLQKNGVHAEVTSEQGNIIRVVADKMDKDFVNKVLFNQAGVNSFTTYILPELTESLQKANVSLTGLSKQKQPPAVFKEMELSNPSSQVNFGDIIQYNTNAGLGQSAEIGYIRVKDTASLNQLFMLTKDMFPPGCNFYYGVPEKPRSKNADPAKEISFLPVYALNELSVFRFGRYVEKANSEKDHAYISVVISLNQAGAKRWERLTEENLQKQIAIVYDGTVISAPTVYGVMTDGKIQITGSFTKEEADNMASVIGSGYLPLQLRVVSNEMLK